MKMTKGKFTQPPPPPKPPAPGPHKTRDGWQPSSPGNRPSGPPPPPPPVPEKK